MNDADRPREAFCCAELDHTPVIPHLHKPGDDQGWRDRCVILQRGKTLQQCLGEEYGGKCIACKPDLQRERRLTRALQALSPFQLGVLATVIALSSGMAVNAQFTPEQIEAIIWLVERSKG